MGGPSNDIESNNWAGPIFGTRRELVRWAYVMDSYLFLLKSQLKNIKGARIIIVSFFGLAGVLIRINYSLTLSWGKNSSASMALRHTILCIGYSTSRMSEPKLRSH